MRHQGFVMGAKFSKNGSQILTRSDSTVYLWNKDGTPAGQPMKHNGNVNGAEFNKDESLILSWSDDATACLWRKDGTLAGQPMKHRDNVRGAEFSKDESLILTWSKDGTVHLWNKDGTPAWHPMKHRYINGAAFSKDESLILSWGDDAKMRLWDIGADYDFPDEHSELLVQAVTGTKTDDSGNVTALSCKEWEGLREKYKEIAERHLKECKYKPANLYLKQKKLWEN